MSYTAEERESVLIANDDNKTWSIYSLQPTVINKLRKAGIQPFKVGEDGSHHYKDIPFNRVSFRAESTRVMSDEQRLAASERLKRAREKK